VATVKQQTLEPTDTPWMVVSDGHPTARAIADRHYSRRHRGASLFVGPGEKLILLSYDLKALFCWRFARLREDNQVGVECTIFRNEGTQQSSYLIIEAEKFAWDKWSDHRLFTYVDGQAIKSTNPGHCFIMAGWRRLDGYRSKDRGLFLLEKLPKDMPLSDSSESSGGS